MQSIPVERVSITVEEQVFEMLVPDPEWVEQRFRVQQDAGIRPDPPYWSRIWHSAMALSGYIIQRPELLRGKQVLELAAGLGLPARVAATLATHVLASDYLPEAVAMLQQNINSFGIKNMEAALLDWNALPEDLAADVVLLSDINYEPEAFDALLGVIRRFLEKDALILLATPQRLMAGPFIDALAPYVQHREEQVVSGTAISILELVGGPLVR
jgi:predicted nicotinamide N-methyase